MHVQLLAAFAALSATTFAAPTVQPFAVVQVATGKKILKNGPADILRTYARYASNATAPQNVIAAAAAVQSGTVAATPQQYDEEYLCPVSIGTPAKTFQLDFDTGSSDLWVFSSLQPTSQQGSHAIYNPSGSSTSSAVGETWKISYGDGSGAAGTVYADKVVVGSVTATSQDVEAATSASSAFVSGAEDGLLGLAFDSINTCSAARCPTFINSVAASLPAQLFTSTLKKGAVGSYDFGYIDSTKYTGSIAYTPVNTANGFWEFTTTAYKVGTAAAVSASLDSIADTGTTLIYMPTAVVKAYYAQVKGATNSAAAGGYIFPCSSTLPNLSFTIGGAVHTVPGSYINFAPYSGSTCYGGLQNSAGIGYNILGDIFLKSQFVVWNFGTTQIGFAQQKGLPSS